jgi:hypothetical protein
MKHTMRSRPLILEFILADAWFPALILASGIVAAWFFLCDFWMLKLIPDRQVWTPVLDRYAFLAGVVLVLLAEFLVFRLLLRGRGPKRRVDLLTAGDRLGARDWAALCRTLQADTKQPFCVRWYMGWQARLLDPWWHRIFRYIAKRSPGPVLLYLVKDRYASAADIARLWHRRPHRWVFRLWPIALCWFLLNSSRPAAWLESRESQQPDIWAADMVREVVASPITGQMQKQPPEPLHRDRNAAPPVFWEVQKDTFPTEMSLYVGDWPRANAYMDVVCRSGVSGGPLSCTCASSLMSAPDTNRQSGVCRVPVRGGIAHFALFRRVDKDQKPIPLRVAVSVLRPKDRIIARAQIMLKEK